MCRGHTGYFIKNSIISKVKIVIFKYGLSKKQNSIKIFISIIPICDINIKKIVIQSIELNDENKIKQNIAKINLLLKLKNKLIKHIGKKRLSKIIINVAKSSINDSKDTEFVIIIIINHI